MKKIILIIIAGMTFNQAPAQMWAIDKAHSQVMFTVSHLVIAEVTGNFKTFNGLINASKDDFSDATVEFSVEVSSLNTESEMRDNHLKSDDFFNAEKFPKITFKGKGMKKISGNKYSLTGNLTIRDITKPITLEVTYFGTVKDPWGNYKAGFKIHGVVNRFDYDLKWNNTTEAGGAVVGQDVTITANLELAKGVK